MPPEKDWLAEKMQSLDDELECKEDLFLTHYTSSEGLLGILNSQTLWFTDARCLNDTSEILYLYPLIREVAKKKGDTLLSNQIDRWIDRELTSIDNMECRREFTNSYLENGVEQRFSVNYPNRRHFLCCFSKQSDKLSMWRSYTKTASCEGYNLTFSSEALRNTRNVTGHGWDIHVYPVIYDVERQKELIDRILKCYSQNLRKEDSIKYWAYFSFLMDKYRCAFKNPAFAEEEEVRLVLTCDIEELFCKEQGVNDGAGLHFRNANGCLTPYFVLPIDLTLIKCIGLSPMKNKREVEFVQLLIRQYGIQPEIKLSNIPLRF